MAVDRDPRKLDTVLAVLGTMTPVIEELGTEFIEGGVRRAMNGRTPDVPLDATEARFLARTALEVHVAINRPALQKRLRGCDPLVYLMTASADSPPAERVWVGQFNRTYLALVADARLAVAPSNRWFSDEDILNLLSLAARQTAARLSHTSHRR